MLEAIGIMGGLMLLLALTSNWGQNDVVSGVARLTMTPEQAQADKDAAAPDGWTPVIWAVLFGAGVLGFLALVAIGR